MYNIILLCLAQSFICQPDTKWHISNEYMHNGTFQMNTCTMAHFKMNTCTMAHFKWIHDL